MKKNESKYIDYVPNNCCFKKVSFGINYFFYLFCCESMGCILWGANNGHLSSSLSKHCAAFLLSRVHNRIILVSLQTQKGTVC